MKREDLLKYCRYYKGVEKNSKSLSDLDTYFFEKEHIWVEKCINDEKFIDRMNKSFSEYEKSTTDNVQNSLKAFLFFSYARQLDYCSDEEIINLFNTFYKTKYLKK